VVLLSVMLRGVIGIFSSVGSVAACGMRMMGGRFVVAIFMMLSGLVMMLCSLFVVLSRLLVV
jgi:hypothetical protein